MNDHHIIGDVFGYVGDLILGMCRRVSLVYAGDYNGTLYPPIQSEGFPAHTLLLEIVRARSPSYEATIHKAVEAL